MQSQRKIGVVVITMIVSLILVACNGTMGEDHHEESPIPTQGLGRVSPLSSEVSPPPTIVPEAGQGAVVGQIVVRESLWPTRASVFLCPFYWDESRSGGFFLLEPSVHPHVELQMGGYFQISNVRPGSYVIVVGPGPEDAVPIRDDDGEPRVFEVQPDEVLDIGEITLP